MTIDQVIKLSELGFTKEEILALAPAQPVPEPTPAPTPSEPTPAPVVEPTPAPVVEPTPAPTPSAPIQAVLSQEQLTQLAQAINAGGAKVDVPPKYNVDDVLANHFKSLMIGETKED